MKKVSINTKRVLENLLPVIMLAALCIVFAIATNGRFFKIVNLKIILNQALITACVATGAVMIFASSNMNIALGVTTALSCICGGFVFLRTGSVPLMFIGCLAAALVIQVFCTVLALVFHINVITTTMMLMQMLLALQKWLLGSSNMMLDNAVMKSVRTANIPLMMFAVFFVFCFILFQFTKFGRSLRFMGENKNCARQTGLNESRLVTAAFLISAIGIAIGAFTYLVNNVSVTTYSLNSMNMDIMLAIVLGGMPIKGGVRSKIYAGLIGALTVVVIGNGMVMLGVDALWIQAIRGVFFIAIIFLNQKRSKELPVQNMV